MEGTKYGRQGKNVIIVSIVLKIPDNFHTGHHLLWLPKGNFRMVIKSRKEAQIPILGIVPSYSTFSKIPPHRVCRICASQYFFMKKLEITSGIFGVVGICVGVVVVKIIVIFEIQIPRYWVYHPFDPILRSSKFPSWCSISMTHSPSDPRCWGSMHIYIGYFHPKYNFDISQKNSNYEISSWAVYFYRAR